MTAQPDLLLVAKMLDELASIKLVGRRLFIAEAIEEQARLCREADNATGEARTVNRSGVGEGDVLAAVEWLELCAKNCDVYSPDQCATLIDGIGHIDMRHGLNKAAVLIRSLATPEQPGSAVQGGAPLGAIENGRVFADRLEASGFDCEAGKLSMCSDWQEFRRCFEWLAEWAMHEATPPPAPAAEQGEKDWFCATCSNTVDPSAVTFDERHDSRVGGCGMPVTYGMPATQPEAHGVEGMVLVPREPTREMQTAGKHALKGAADSPEWQQALSVYGAMLSASAPNPARAEQPEGKGSIHPDFKRMTTLAELATAIVKNTTSDRDDEAFAADVRDCLIRAQQLATAPAAPVVDDAGTLAPCPKCGCPDELTLDSSRSAEASWIKCAWCDHRMQESCDEETLAERWNALDRSQMPLFDADASTGNAATPAAGCGDCAILRKTLDYWYMQAKKAQAALSGVSAPVGVEVKGYPLWHALHVASEKAGFPCNVGLAQVIDALDALTPASATKSNTAMEKN